MEENKAMVAALLEAHLVADELEDIATASLKENFIDGAERRNWFLFEASRARN
jgi:starvation-inducible DNA-binding protein